jgi:hypothetical protein
MGRHIISLFSLFRKKNESKLMRLPCCLCVCICIPSVVARKRFGKHVTEAGNTHATIEELLGTSFSMRSVLYRRKVGY